MGVLPAPGRLPLGKRPLTAQDRYIQSYMARQRLTLC